MVSQRLDQVIELMSQFVIRTGRTGEQRRYLWTDALAVENLIHLTRLTGESQFEQQALKLVAAVHQVLAHHRPDEPRRHGWLSGLEEAEAAAHPTIAGLRIGKKLPERPPGAPIDERAEWDRDGQYFHYLTRWMMALHHLANHTGERRYQTWAEELAITAHRAFTHRETGRPRLYWKMSIDLSRPLVASMGHHDAIDGLITCLQLERTGGGLQRIIADFSAMLGNQELTTPDPLGLGGLLLGAYQLDTMPEMVQLRDWILHCVTRGLPLFLAQAPLSRPAQARLAFREFGLAQGLGRARQLTRGAAEAFQRFDPIYEQIMEFWLTPEHRNNPTWDEHQDINEVMLASALLAGLP